MNRIPALIVWSLLLLVAIGLGAPIRDDLGSWLWGLLTLRWSAIDSSVIALFWVMGLWPALVGLLIRPDWTARIPAWPFVVVSFGLGCFALLPWFILRNEPRRVSEDGWFARWDVPLIVIFVALAFIVWGGMTGNPNTLVPEARSDGVLFAMMVDFLAFWTLSIVEARARTRGTPWQITFIPLFGLGWFLVQEERLRRREVK